MQKYTIYAKIHKNTQKYTKMQKYTKIHSQDRMALGLRPRGILSLLGTLYPIEHSRSLSNPYYTSCCVTRVT